jgi:hypothetical protein
MRVESFRLEEHYGPGIMDGCVEMRWKGGVGEGCWGSGIFVVFSSYFLFETKLMGVETPGLEFSVDKKDIVLMGDRGHQWGGNWELCIVRDQRNISRKIWLLYADSDERREWSGG